MCTDACLVHDCSFKSFAFDCKNESICWSFACPLSHQLRHFLIINFHRHPFHWLHPRNVFLERVMMTIFKGSSSGKGGCLMEVENHLIYFAITFEIHLLHHHYHFVKTTGKRGKEKIGKSFFSIIRSFQSSFIVEDGKKSNLIWKPEMKTPVISALIFPFSFFRVWFVRHFSAIEKILKVNWEAFLNNTSWLKLHSSNYDDGLIEAFVDCRSFIICLI